MRSYVTLIKCNRFSYEYTVWWIFCLSSEERTGSLENTLDACISENDFFAAGVDLLKWELGILVEGSSWPWLNCRNCDRQKNWEFSEITFFCQEFLKIWKLAPNYPKTTVGSRSMATPYCGVLCVQKLLVGVASNASAPYNLCVPILLRGMHSLICN